MNNFWAIKILWIFFGVLQIPDIFWGEWEMLGPSRRMKKKESTPSPPSPPPPPPRTCGNHGHYKKGLLF